MIDTLEEDFILVARARGMPNSQVVFKYAMKNVLLPVITVIGLHIGIFLGGAVVAETIFAWNGLGRLMVTSIGRKDYPLVQGILLITSLLFVLINLAIDILYTFIDPRLRIVTKSRAKKAS